MTLLPPCLIACSPVGETFHAAADTVMLGPFITNHVLNCGWFKGLFRERYTPHRVMLTAVNLRQTVWSCN